MNSLEDQRYVVLQLKAIYFVHSSGNTQIQEHNQSCQNIHLIWNGMFENNTHHVYSYLICTRIY